MTCSRVRCGGAGRRTSAFAVSTSSPFKRPSGYRVMRPPEGTGVVPSIVHRNSAAELRMYSCPPRTSTTGLFGATRSRSSRRGRRCSRSCASCQSLLEAITSPASEAATRAPIAAATSASERALDRSTPGPPPAPWRWLSIRPGMTVCPFRSISFVEGPASDFICSLLPTAMKRSPAIATASATRNVGSTVITFPPWKTKSGAGGRGICRGCAAMAPTASMPTTSAEETRP